MYNDLIELTVQARAAYHEMVDALAKEVAEYGGVLGKMGVNAIYSHFGHSRTPSGCSAKSFTSCSILSEPLPEPLPEPRAFTAEQLQHCSSSGSGGGSHSDANAEKPSSSTPSQPTATSPEACDTAEHPVCVNEICSLRNCCSSVSGIMFSELFRQNICFKFQILIGRRFLPIKI